VLFRAKGKRVHVDTSVGVASVVLVGLDEVKVGSFALRESVLTVELQLGGNNGILSPAVHVKGGLGHDEGSGIRDTSGGVVTHNNGVIGDTTWNVPLAGSASGDINGSRVREETSSVDEVASNSGLGSTERHDGVGEGIDTISVVEGLSTKGREEGGSRDERRAVVNVGVRLNNEHQLLAGVVEVELDLVGGRTDGFITSELKLLNEVFVGVLGHASAFISVQEHVVNVEGRGN